MKLGPSARGYLFIKLTPFPNHHLVLVVMDDDFRYALISVKAVLKGMYQKLVMEDIGWLNVERICAHGREVDVAENEVGLGKRKRDAGMDSKASTK